MCLCAEKNVAMSIYYIWATTCDFQQCGILTRVNLDQPVQPPFKLRNCNWWLVSSLSFIEYLSDYQRLWSDCAYAPAGVSFCWSHIPHCWKSPVAAHMFWFRLRNKTIPIQRPLRDHIQWFLERGYDNNLASTNLAFHMSGHKGFQTPPPNSGKLQVAIGFLRNSCMDPHEKHLNSLCPVATWGSSIWPSLKGKLPTKK